MANPVRPDAASRTIAARDVIGLPWLPPAWASTAVDRLRRALAGAHRRAAPPPLRIVEAALGAVDHAALVALCELGVPDALDRPTTAAELASRLGVDGAALGILLRHAAARRWLRLTPSGRVCRTRATRFLARDHPGGWRAWVDLAGRPEVQAALAALGPAARRGEGAFTVANGATFFDAAAANRALGTVFDEAMAAGGRLHGLALAAALDWSDARRVCDVGGGTGSLLATLLEAQPHLEGVLFDRPEVVGAVAPSARLTVVGGDAFVVTPGECDVYLLVNVLHDWDDERAVRLLQGVAEAAPPGARVVVVEAERQRRPTDGIAARTDVLMLALTPGGHERTRQEMTELARRAGLRLERAVALASTDRAFVLGRPAAAS